MHFSIYSVIFMVLDLASTYASTMKTVNSQPPLTVSLIDSINQFHSDKTMSIDFAATWKNSTTSQTKMPSKSAAEMCALRSFQESHDNMFDSHYTLSSILTVSATTNNHHSSPYMKNNTASSSSSMQFRSLVYTSELWKGDLSNNFISSSDGHHHTPNEDPIPDDSGPPNTEDTTVEGMCLCDSPCGPKCRPDDGVYDNGVSDDSLRKKLEEPRHLDPNEDSHDIPCAFCPGPPHDIDHVDITMQEKNDMDEPRPLNPDGNNDDLPCAFCPPHHIHGDDDGDDADVMSQDELIRLVAHLDWQDAFCSCLNEIEHELGGMKDCKIVISNVSY